MPSGKTAIENVHTTHSWPKKVQEGLHYLRTGIVNVCFVSQSSREGEKWFLIDAGLPGYSSEIMKCAQRLFGDQPPRFILLTHGHFDHVGSVISLAEQWQTPVYAHPLEVPYLIGQSSYPPPDPTVGGGLIASLSWAMPRRPVDLRNHLKELPSSGEVPEFSDWQWIHTPGHTPGHISIFREHDRTLIAGDAFVTVKQESFLAVIMQKREIHGPPAYFTTDWIAAEGSVRKLDELFPEVVITGHGRPMYGTHLRNSLHRLARNFSSQARPADGRYVRQRAIADLLGTRFVPPDVPHPGFAFAAGCMTGVLMTALLGRNHERSG